MKWIINDVIVVAQEVHEDSGEGKLWICGLNTIRGRLVINEKLKKYVLDLEKKNFVICCKKGYGGFVDGNDGNSTKQWSLHIASYYCNKNFCYIGRICSGNFLYWFESMHHKGYKRIQMHLRTEKSIARVAEIFYTCIEWTIWLETQLGIFIGVKTTGQVKWKN